MNTKLYVGGTIVDSKTIVLFAAMDSDKPAIVMSFGLDAPDDCAATINALHCNFNGPDITAIRLYDAPLFKFGDNGWYYRDKDECMKCQVHALDVSKAGWADALRLYEWAGLTDWRDPKYARLRKWKSTWWQLVVDLFDLDMDI